MINLSLHYDFRAPEFGPDPSAIYSTALEQCAWGDALGFTRVTLSSHHGSDDNYGPSPLIAGAAIAGVTKAMRIIPVVPLPLYHPLHVAEDVAVLDQLSGGRIDLMVVAGYVAAEYAMFGRSMNRRGALMEEGIRALRQAWTGEQFQFRGETVRVRPRPMQRPGPAIVIGGDSRGAARRAARLGDGYAAMAGGDSWNDYVEACIELGRAVPQRSRRQTAMFVYVSEDPEAAWPKLAPHLMHVNNSYARWMTADARSQSYTWADTLDDLKSGPACLVLTPDECVRRAREWGGVMFDPLCGGIPPDLSWASLDLVQRTVMPLLNQTVPGVPADAGHDRPQNDHERTAP